MKLRHWIMALALLTGCSKEKPTYQTTDLTRGELIQSVTATGQLNPVTNVQVGCQISGTIEQLFADYNSPVTNGQIVAQLDARSYRANLLQAEGELASAQASLKLAQINAARAEQLFHDKLIPQADFDQAVATLQQTQAQVQIRTATVENARVNLARCTIYSPVDGIVISRNVDVGQTVAASLNAPTLFVIANDLTKMQINANVAEADIGGVAEGQAVEFTVDAFPNRLFHGQVVQVRNSPLTVQNVVTYDTVIAVNNHELKLKPGMTANISVIIARRPDTLKIPNAALRFRLPDPTGTNTPARAPAGAGRKRGERSPTRTVYVLDAAGKPQPVQITVGITDGAATEVVAGLTDGDKVITSSTARPTTATPANPFSPTMPRRF
ncbi:MAG: Macrolide export protein MacA [Verrucomicrobiae bacterium]|nr:Macrolide export protein MacA [Verrucomicrobiae bacterium]